MAEIPTMTVIENIVDKISTAVSWQKRIIAASSIGLLPLSTTLIVDKDSTCVERLCSFAGGRNGGSVIRTLVLPHSLDKSPGLCLCIEALAASGRRRTKIVNKSWVQLLRQLLLGLLPQSLSQ